MHAYITHCQSRVDRDAVEAASYLLAVLHDGNIVCGDNGCQWCLHGHHL